MIGVGHLDPHQINDDHFRHIISKLLNPDNTMNLLSCDDYDGFDNHALRMFTHLSARYLLPTIELVHFLREFIGGDRAIEIGSGAGDLARFLGIPATDNFCQEWPEVRAMYQMTQQPTISYGKEVHRLDALEAIDLYKPDIVIGAWVTQWIDPDLPPPPGGGNIYGIKEEEVIKKVKTYVVVGAEEVHKHKAIMRLPHATIDATKFVRSRRKDNRIWIWRQ